MWTFSRFSGIYRLLYDKMHVNITKRASHQVQGYVIMWLFYIYDNCGINILVKLYLLSIDIVGTLYLLGKTEAKNIPVVSPFQ